MVNKTEFYRVLTPGEAKAIIKAIPKRNHKMCFRTSLYSGMRYIEAKRFGEHPEWFRPERNMVIIPKKFTKTKYERKVNLTPQFSEMLTIYLEGDSELKYPSYQSWNKNLSRWAQRAGIEDYINVSAGTTCKTWESWLFESGFNVMRILASQGHDSMTSLKHYYSNSWTPNERYEIKMETSGWE